ncbi:NRDE family protein [Shewanella sp. NIFS-20-20]|uniref:NRDE family protein n=1 Tax=Shewanella sp. NIFS-20-20 TaxID=2853806 RepID=UPI001C463EAF|nr:NRDE family protein [Shewanella sp. NIFS-20-20]MBV7316051.1 NRDE family protein [Shewanella sp. NIFS-20-20]
MCILFLAINSHPDYPLIVCANRDEFHHRATQPLHQWQQPSGIIAGRDLQAGGTWLGINQQGQFAALTNLRTPQANQANRLSRGDLVIKALSAEPMHKWLLTNADKYNPFNLIYQQGQDYFCFNSMSARSHKLSSGFHAISNGAMDDEWPKMATGRKALEEAISSSSQINRQQLLPLLQDQSRPSDDLLPNTGIGREWERLLSAIFIISPDYGTRSASILIKNQQGQLELSETRFNQKGKTIGSEVINWMCDHG